MTKIDFNAYPDEHGRFGAYGGSYVAETLMAPLAELTTRKSTWSEKNCLRPERTMAWSSTIPILIMSLRPNRTMVVNRGR